MMSKEFCVIVIEAIGEKLFLINFKLIVELSIRIGIIVDVTILFDIPKLLGRVERGH